VAIEDDDAARDRALSLHRFRGAVLAAEVSGLQPGVEYEYRVVAKHPLLTVASEEIALVAPTSREP
jgi:hypothetical protein